jgi:hypothetical protein
VQKNIKLFRLLFTKQEKKTNVGRRHRRWENNIKILLKEIVRSFGLDSCDREYEPVLLSFGQHEESLCIIKARGTASSAISSPRRTPFITGFVTRLSYNILNLK